MRATKTGKRLASIFLLAAMVLMLLAGCGKSEPTEKKGETDPAPKQTEKASESAGQKDKDEGKKGQTSSAAALRAAIDAANTGMQSSQDNMAFDEEYIYFVANHDRYRCRYDGSDVQKLEKELENVTMAEGKLWGYWQHTGYQEPGAVYSMDPKTCAMTMVTEMPFAGQDANLIQVSGNWLCYARDKGNELVVYDLAAGTEKVIFAYAFGDLLRSVESCCIYGNTLYALIRDTSKDFNCVLCACELGAADIMTRLSQTMSLHGETAPIWMEDGLLLTEEQFGGETQYYYAKFADIDVENKKWEFKEDKNKIGVVGDSYTINNKGYSRYVLGNDLLMIDGMRIHYYAGFDYQKDQILAEDIQGYRNGIEMCHGIHDGSVYVCLEKSSSEAEILKISEGGTVERFSVALPEA